MSGIINAGQAMVKALVAHGVQRCYTVPGESFLPLLDAVSRSDALRLVSTRHESGASFMAAADARLTGTPAVAMATRGPGAANLSIGVQNAHEGSTPMLVILGDVETDLTYRGAFQEVDLAAMYSPITKLALRAGRGDRLEELTAYGLREAVADRAGPVVITVPQDLFEMPVPDEPSPIPPVWSVPAAPDDATVVRIDRSVRKASAPVAIVGEAAASSRDELVRFAEQFGVGMYTAHRRQDAFPNNHPNYLGHLGLAPTPATLAALRGADLVVVFGSRMDEVTTQRFTLPPPGCLVIQVDPDASTLARAAHRPTEAVVAGVRSTLSALLAKGGPASSRTWVTARSAFVDSTVPPASRSAAALDPVDVIAAMRAEFPQDTIITSDAGNFASSLHRFWTFDHPLSQLAPTNGAMGYAVPAGVAAALAAPGRQVVSVVGDGGFLMTGQEVETAVREGVSLTVVVMRNGLYGTIAMHQSMRSLPLTATTIGPVNVAGFATALGAEGRTATTVSELISALRDARASTGVVVIDAVLDPDLITPAARLSTLGRISSS